MPYEILPAASFQMTPACASFPACRCSIQHSEPGSDKRGAKVDELALIPLELIDRIATLVPVTDRRIGSTL
jgi:hypothetical protein